MSAVPTPSDAAVRPLFADGLGERVSTADDATGEPLHRLRIRPALTAVPTFEGALRERTVRLAGFRHPAFAAIRRIDRAELPEPGLSIVSERIEGTRLADLLRAVEARSVRLDITIAMSLIRQLVPAVAQLHEHARDVAHGLLAPERLVITPHARLMVVEHVLGSAVEQLRLTRERLWQDLRVALPSVAGLSRFDQRADVTAVGLVALALLLGRPLRASEFPHGVAALLGEARERTAGGDEQPLSAPLREWLARSLQLDPRRPFRSAVEALAVLEEAVAGGAGYGAPPLALQKFLARHAADLLEPPAPIESAAPRVAATDLRPIAVKSIDGTRLEAPPIEAAPIDAAPVVPAAEPPPASGLVSVVREAAETAAPLERTAAKEAVVSPTNAPAKRIIELIATDELLAPQQAGGAPLFEDESTSPSAGTLRRAGESETVAPRFRLAAVGAAVLVMAAGGYAAPKLLKAPTGTVDVQSSPAGVDIIVDGERRGATPARLALSAGPHLLELRGRGAPRVTPITVIAGTETTQSFELIEKPQTGQLRVPSQPAGARVLVDGVARGTAPVTVAQLAPGNHEVVLQSPTGSLRQTVIIRAGLATSLVLPDALEAAAAPTPGWIVVTSPVAVEVREGGRLLGISGGERLTLGAGRHQLEIANPALDYRLTRPVQIASNKATELVVELPSGSVNLNAAPWAEVFIDGERVGETPIGNLPVAIGSHEVLFRNPQLGEKRQAISVTLAAPVRLSVDMK